MATTDTLDTSLEQALQRLFSLQTFGIKLGLEPVTALLERFGNPHRNWPAVHVAGTNGKGSVCAMTAAVFTAAGYKVGLYSSPHLIHFSERIKVNGVPIPQEDLARYAAEMMPVIEELGCTFFEGTTAMAFRYFAEQQVDIAIIETGMGGRLDATNVVTPLISAITSIGFDHMKHLGDTLELIAAEKAGIIKPGIPAVVGHVAPRLKKVFINRGIEIGAPVHMVDGSCRAIYNSMDFEGITGTYITAGRQLDKLRISLAGRHQLHNARVALSVLEELCEKWKLTDEHIRDGFGNVQKFTGIEGRFQSVGTQPRVIIDVAHNADGARVLTDTLSHLVAHKKLVHFVFGAVEDKDVGEIARIFQPIARQLYAVRAHNERSLPAKEIAHFAKQAIIPTEVCGDVESGIARALAAAEAHEVIVVCGSFYVVGEALQSLPHIAEENQLVQERYPSADAETLPASGSQIIPAQEKAARSKLTVKEWNESEQPRERLMAKGAAALSNAELLAILLRTGTKENNVLQVSQNLINKFKSLNDIASRDFRELQALDGIGPTKAVTLAAAFELGTRMKTEPFSSRPKINSPQDVANIYIPELRGVHKEQFHVLVLNTANQVIRRELVSEGNLNSSIVHPREVFRTAIIENAHAIIGLHNHPSGNPAASKEDIAITKQLVQAGKIIGISFHDHIIIAGESFVSLAELGYV